MPSSYQKRVDYAFRAVHMTAVEAKRIAAAYYGRAAAYSYWDGCSTGGRQGLISAQRFPQDFDGIVAGAPVLNFVDTVTQSLWNGLVLVETPVPVAKMKLVADAVYARCDAKDGLKDGLIDDPRRCDFDPARDVAQCPAGQDGATCLTPAQSAAIKKIYAGRQVDGKPAHFGQPVGAETTGTSVHRRAARPTAAGTMWLIAAGRRQSRCSMPTATASCATSLRQARSVARCAKFDFDKDIAQFADARALLNATDPNLGAVPLARRQAADVFRLGRHRAAAADGHRLLHEGGGRQRARHAGLLPPVHGARHVPLPRRRRHRPARR